MRGRGNRGLALGVAAFVLAAALRLVAPAQASVLPDAALSLASVYAYVGIIVAWMASAHRRLLPSRLRSFALASTGCMLAWMLVRSLKYRLLNVDYLVNELLWYAYYPLQFGVLLFLLLACIQVARRGKPPLHGVQAALALACAVLSCVVLTNGLHQLAFDFGPGYPQNPDDYRRGPVYWACVALLAGMALASLVVLERSRGVRVLAHRDAMPLGIAAVAVVYLVVRETVIIPMGLRDPFTFPEVVCFATLLVWEWLIRVRLIPSNDRYGELFAAMAIPACIVDGRMAPVFHSGTPLPATPGQMREALAGPVRLDADTRLQAVPVTAGAMCWAADLSAVNRMNEALREAGEQLAGENDLLAAENELAAQAARTKAREVGYDRALEAVQPQLREISARVADMDPVDPGFARDLALLAVEGAYVKRAMNLRLLAAGEDGGSGEGGGGERRDALRELALSIQEVLAACRRAGIACAFTWLDDEGVEADRHAELGDEADSGEAAVSAMFDVAQVFDAFWQALNPALPAARSLRVNLLDGGLVEVEAR